MPNQRFIAERRDEGIHLQRIVSEAPAAETGVMRLVIAGLGTAEELAREAATSHFERHPARTKVLIEAIDGSPSWLGDNI